jgi:hypothetical protein
MKAITIALVVVSLLASNARAGGLIGDIIRAVPGGKGLGDTLDEGHKRLKETIPPYGQAEEGVSGAVRHGTQQVVGEAGAPALANWILSSRNDALRAGTNSMPPGIRAAFSGFFSEELLDSVRFRVGQGHELSLQANSFRFGDAAAITLDNVIVFRTGDDVHYNLALWAHELGHVQQYKVWGVFDFAKSYLRNYREVESGAEDTAGRFVAWYEQRRFAGQPVSSPVPPKSLPEYRYSGSNICSTPWGACQIPQVGPVGTSCWCGTYQGPVWGTLAPIR